MASFDIELLGGFNLAYGQTPVAGIRSARHQSILAYLVLNRHAPQSREHVAFTFWPESIESQALNNLRKALHFLRQQIPNADLFIHSDAKQIQWREDSSYSLDVDRFEHALSQAEQNKTNGDSSSAKLRLIDAVQLYRGDLLPSCYDDWISSPRERLRDHYLGALSDLVHLLQETPDLVRAIRYANQLLRSDPLSEHAHRQLMHLHMLNNDPGSALRVYHVCVSTLRHEFGVDPGVETRALYNNLLRSEHASPSTRAVASQSTTVAFVGRKEEWKQLRSVWDETVRGQPRCAIVTGEAGIGKTRLIEEFCNWAREREIAVAYTRAYAAKGTLSYEPITDWLRMPHFQPRWHRLDVEWLTELARVLPELISEMPHVPRPQPITEGWQKKRLFEALANAVLASGRPLVVALDDLQWCDPDTLDWLLFLLRFDQTAPLFLMGGIRLGEILTERASEHPLATFLATLRERQLVAEIELTALDRTDTDALATQFLKQSPDDQYLAHLHQVSQGNPLFAIEMLRGGVTTNPSDGDGQAQIDHMPAKVRNMIEARLAQLSPAAITIAQAAAVIGAEFSSHLISLVCAAEIKDGDLVPGLDELWQRRIFREHGEDSYDYSHDRIRDVVLAGIRPARRRQLHQTVANSLFKLHHGDVDFIYAQLAGHHFRAGEYATAADYFTRAAEQSRGLHAFGDAVRLLKLALEAVAKLPASRARDIQKLNLLLTLGPAIVQSVSAAHPDMLHVYEEALLLCDRPGFETHLYRVQRGLWLHYLLIGQHDHAEAYAKKNLNLARSVHEPSWIGEAERCLGLATWFMGKPAEAASHMKEAIRLNSPEQLIKTGGVLDSGYGLDHISIYALTLWVCGFPNQSTQQDARAMAFIRAMRLPFAMTFALEFSAMAAYFQRKSKTVSALASELATLASKYDFAEYRIFAEALSGWATAVDFDANSGARRIASAIEASLKISVESEQTFYYALLAEAHLRDDRPGEALLAVSKGLALAAKNGENFWTAELHRLWGESALACGQPSNAVEKSFFSALEIARSQEARSLELRAATSFAKHLIASNRHEEALRVLEPVYNWFTEGFETPDLVDARLLLDRLSTTTAPY